MQPAGFGGGAGGSFSGNPAPAGFGGGAGGSGSNTGGGGGAGLGGAIFNRGSLTATNTTFTNNTAAGGSGTNGGQGLGGAIFNKDGTVDLDSATVAFNSGGGVYSLELDGQADLKLTNSIVAKNGAADCKNTGGTVGAPLEATNLIITNSGCGTPSQTTDPLLGGLALNGGLTPNHSIGPGSPAYEAGTCTQTTDQRGMTRPGPGSSVCDIGAFESQIPPTAELSVTKSCGAGPALPGDQVACTITVANAGPIAAQNVSVSDDLPAAVTLVGAPSGIGFTCGTGDPFVCTRASLGVTSVVISYSVRVSDDVAAGTQLKNTATVTQAGAEQNTNDNAADATISMVACTPGFDFSAASAGRTIRGSAGPDVICGSAFGDTIQGLGGDDIVFGNGGNDSIQGNEGNDKLFGGAGDDTITGPPGVDGANGGSGYDRCASRTNTACEVAQIA